MNRLRKNCFLDIVDGREVTAEHGLLVGGQQDIPAMMVSTNRSRAELFRLWFRFKALCALSSHARGVDRAQFAQGCGFVAIEADDIAKIESCFDEYDTDRSGVLNWPQFARAVAAVEANEYTTAQMAQTPATSKRKKREKAQEKQPQNQNRQQQRSQTHPGGGETKSG